MIKRLLTVSFLVLGLLAVAATALAAPQAQERRPVIAQPEADANVRGVVQIVGSATHPQFQRYELYYAPWPVPSDQAWIFIGDAHFTQQPLGLLGTWPSTALPDGAYGLRVRVVKADGNYIDSEPRRVIVANRRALDTPTPAPTRLSEFTATPAPPTAIVPIIAPTVQSSRPTAAPAAQPTATPILSGSAGATASSSQLFNLARLKERVITAATYTLGAFLAVGAFFAVKWLLAWLWHKIRP